MPLSKYYAGHGAEVMTKMKKQYGAEKAKQVFYATANKRAKKVKAPGRNDDLNKKIPGHRMTFAEAYARRTTDSSRARVMKKYGVTSAPRSFQPVDNAPRSFQPVTGPNTPKPNPTGGAQAPTRTPRRRRRRLPSSPGMRHYL